MRRRLLPAAALLALVAPGCVKAVSDIEVADDGSGRIDMLFAVQEDATSGLFAELDDPGMAAFTSNVCTDMMPGAGEVPAGATVEPYRADGFCGFRLQAEWGATSDPGAVLRPILVSQDDSVELSLVRGVDGSWNFTYRSDQEAIASGDEAGLAMAEEMFPGFSFRLELTLPGRPVSHNATSVDGNTFVWDLGIADPITELRASTEPGSVTTDGFPWAIALAGVGVLVALVLVVTVRRPPRRGPLRAPAGLGQVGRGPAAAATPVGRAPEPTWDAATATWVIDHPRLGRLRQDLRTGSWVPVDAPVHGRV